MKELRNNIEYCPHCNINLQGEEIPKESQWMYGATHFSRKIGIYSNDIDMTTHYVCPDCLGTWDRFEDDKL